MREDMHEVLVERPRGGGRFPFRARRLAYERAARSRDGDESLPARMPMRIERTKYLSENLRPLVRFLRTRAGRRWDDVFREISANIRLTNAVQRHVRQHLDEMIRFERRERGSAVLALRRRTIGLESVLLPDGRVLGWPSYLLCGTLYVDLEGVLRFVPKDRHTRRPP